MPRHVRRSRLIVGTCSSMSVYSLYVFGKDGLVSGRVRRGSLSVDTCRRDVVSVGTCSARWALCRHVFNDFGLDSVRVRRSRVSVGK